MIRVDSRPMGGKRITKTGCPVIIYLDNMKRVSYVNANTKKKMDTSYTLRRYLPEIKEMMQGINQ